MSRKFYDEDLVEWEAYVSGGQPGTATSARIYFNCLTDRTRRPRYVAHETGHVAEAQRALSVLETRDLIDLLGSSEPLS